MNDHETSSPMRAVSLIIREWTYPTLFWLKYENESVCRWSKLACLRSCPTPHSTRDAEYVVMQFAMIWIASVTRYSPMNHGSVSVMPVTM